MIGAEPTDEEVLAFRARLTATVKADEGRDWGFSDVVVRLIDYCNRALGCGMHDGQVWRGAAGFTDSPDRYARCGHSREIVASAMAELRRIASLDGGSS